MLSNFYCLLPPKHAGESGSGHGGMKSPRDRDRLSVGTIGVGNDGRDADGLFVHPEATLTDHSRSHTSPAQTADSPTAMSLSTQRGESDPLTGCEAKVAEALRQLGVHCPPDPLASRADKLGVDFGDRGASVGQEATTKNGVVHICLPVAPVLAFENGEDVGPLWEIEGQGLCLSKKARAKVWDKILKLLASTNAESDGKVVDREKEKEKGISKVVVSIHTDSHTSSVLAAEAVSFYPLQLQGHAKRIFFPQLSKLSVNLMDILDTSVKTGVEAAAAKVVRGIALGHLKQIREVAVVGRAGGLLTQGALAAAAATCGLLHSLPSLTTLTVAHVPLGGLDGIASSGHVLEALCGALVVCKALLEVNLQGGRLGLRGVGILLQSLVECPSLSCVNLAGTLN